MRKKKKRHSSLHACIHAHECIPEPGAGGSKDRTTALLSFAGVKEDPHLGCTDFFFRVQLTHTRIWISKYLPFKEWRLLYYLQWDTALGSHACTWGQSLILAGNEIHYCTLMGTLFKDHSKKIILSLGMWHIVTTHIGSWVYTSKAVQLHPIYLIFVHQFSCLHNGNNINPTVLL